MQLDNSDNTGDLCLPNTHLPSPLSTTFSPWDGPLLSMLTMSEVSWEPTPLLT